MTVDPELAQVVQAIAQTEEISPAASLDKIVKMGLSRWHALRKYAGKSVRFRPKRAAT